jgi:hypothetical protein
MPNVRISVIWPIAHIKGMSFISIAVLSKINHKLHFIVFFALFDRNKSF